MLIKAGATRDRGSVNETLLSTRSRLLIINPAVTSTLPWEDMKTLFKTNKTTDALIRLRERDGVRVCVGGDSSDIYAVPVITGIFWDTNLPAFYIFFLVCGVLAQQLH